MEVTFRNGKTEKEKEEIEKLVEERKQARLEKNWALSDEIRNKLIENGYQVEDSKDGMTVKKM